jgi:hypothetical protein
MRCERLQQLQTQREVAARIPAIFGLDSFGSVGWANQKKEHAMKRMTALVLAAAFFSVPAAAQTKGKSATAPGNAGTTPGQQQSAPGAAKNLAPGQVQTGPGGAKTVAPGAEQRK